MPEEFEIVDATMSDIKAIQEIQSQTWLINYPNEKAGITKEDILEKIREWEEQGDERIATEMKKPGVHSWVVRKEGQVVGFIAVLKKETENSINAFHVLPSFQGKGLGSRLLTTAFDWLGNEKKITLEVVAYNTGAQRLYERFGFKKIDRSEGEFIALPSGKIIPKINMERE